MCFVKIYFADKSVLSFEHDNDSYGYDAIFDLVTEFERIYETSFLGLDIDVVMLPLEDDTNET